MPDKESNTNVDLCPVQKGVRKMEFSVSDINNSKPARLYHVRKTWKYVNSQIGAYYNLANAKDVADKAGNAYGVLDLNGKKCTGKPDRRSHTSSG